MNTEDDYTLESPYSVLIDTWWNVNYTSTRSQINLYLRFNRYMVECESVISYVPFSMSPVLIDTWWNVNFLSAL